MIISILTIFPDMVRAVFDYGVVGQAIKKNLIQINPIDLRNFTSDKHRSVDGRPFGGGPGMVGRVDVIDRALQSLLNGEASDTVSRVGRPGIGLSETPIHDFKLREVNIVRTVLLSPQGKMFNQQIAQEYSQLDHLILISGRYEGVDERVAKYLADEELSIGNYVLSGGEIPAMTVADAVARLIPRVLGKPESLESETCENKFDYPVYTEPIEYKSWKVPEILRSGNHQKIKEWRKEQAEIKSKHQRLEIE